MWRKEDIGCPAQESWCKVPKFCIDVNLPNFIPNKQEDKGTSVGFLISFLSHVCIWHVINKVIQNPEKDSCLTYNSGGKVRELFSIKTIFTRCTVWHPRLGVRFLDRGWKLSTSEANFFQTKSKVPPLTLVQWLRAVLFLIRAPPLVLKIASGSRLWMVEHGIHLCTCALFSWARVNQHPPAHQEGWMVSGQEMVFCWVSIP